MKVSALFIVTTDPRRSSRPAEAVRIAAGVGAWKRADVCVYLRGAAVLALGQSVDELVDAENFARYLPLIVGLGRPVYVEQGGPLLASIGTAAVSVEEIPDSALANLAAMSTYVIRF